MTLLNSTKLVEGRKQENITNFQEQKLKLIGRRPERIVCLEKNSLATVFTQYGSH